MSGFCNGCGCPLNTRNACWCKPCHAGVVERLKQKAAHRLGGRDFDGTLFVPLHVGFVFVEETAEMVLRLLGEPVLPAKPAAASKIADPAGRVPCPVDRVASRVSGIHEG